MSLIRKLRDRLQGATLHDLWVETRWVLHHSKRYRRSIAAYVLLGIASIALSLLSSLSSRELINAIVYLQGGGRRVLFCGVTVVLLAGSTIVLNALVSRFSNSSYSSKSISPEVIVITDCSLYCWYPFRLISFLTLY